MAYARPRIMDIDATGATRADYFPATAGIEMDFASEAPSSRETMMRNAAGAPLRAGPIEGLRVLYG